MSADTQKSGVTAQSAVVFLHGFLGGPQQFDFLLPVAAAAGYDTHTLLLPGHGGDYRAFLGSSRRSWQAHVQSELNTLCAQYTRVLLVAHSMGGLLSILATLNNPGRVCGIFCLALPLHLKVSFHGIRNNVKYVTGLGKQDALIKAARESCSVSGITFYNAPLMVRQLLDLSRLSIDARRALHQLNVPLMALHSQHDECVSKKSIQAIKYARTQEIIVLPASSHFLYPENDRATVCEAFSCFASACFSR